MDTKEGIEGPTSALLKPARPKVCGTRAHTYARNSDLIRKYGSAERIQNISLTQSIYSDVSLEYLRWQ